MSCNTLTDDRLELKTSAPYRVGSFWLEHASENAKEFVRAITRLNTQSNLWKATDYLQNLAGNSSPLINGLDYSIKIDWKSIQSLNFDRNNYLNTSGNGFTKEQNIPLRKIDLSRAGVYGLESDTFAPWTDIYGIKWLFPVSFNPESVNPFTPEAELVTGPAYVLQPKQVMSIQEKYPTVILSKNSYHVYGLDFEIDNDSISFYTPMEEIFEERIHVVSSYQAKESLLAFPFSIDKNVRNTNHIGDFLRVSNSLLYLQKALCQLVGYTDTAKDILVKNSVTIPGGTFTVTSELESFIFGQYEEMEGFYPEGTFVGNPLRLLTGDEALAYVQNNGLTLPCYPKNLNIQNGFYLCTNYDGFVYIDFENDDLNNYLNPARENYESNVRYDINGDIAQTFSSYLIDKFPGLNTFPSEVRIDIITEFFNFYSQNIVVLQMSDKLDQQQKDAVLAFLETHSLTNAIIIYNENAYYTDI
jgi:hypothetical protein